MEWLILFFASWLLFFIVVDLKKLKINIFSGIIAIAIQLSIDYEALNRGLYYISNPIVKVLGSSIFFTCGPVFVIGVLLSQFQYKNKIWIVSNVVVLTILFSVQEILLILRNCVTYVNWSFYDSLAVNLFTMILLSWFSYFVINWKNGDLL